MVAQQSAQRTASRSIVVRAAPKVQTGVRTCVQAWLAGSAMFCIFNTAAADDPQHPPLHVDAAQPAVVDATITTAGSGHGDATASTAAADPPLAADLADDIASAASTTPGNAAAEAPTEPPSELDEAANAPAHRFDAAEAAASQFPAAGQSAPAGQGDDEDDDPSALEECAEMEGVSPGLLQKIRRSLSVTACASSAWLDGLFGDQFLSEDYHQTYGTVSVGGIWSDYDGFDPRLRFRVRLQLPQWDERISAFAGRVSEDEYITDTEGDFVALPTRQFGSPEDESVLVGLGYSSPERTGNDFDVGVGVRVDLPLDPYVRARYEIVRTFSDHYVFTARETLFWQNSEGFGSTTRIHLDRFISERFLLRWATLGKFTEETIGLQWFTQFTLFQSLNERTGLAWQVQTEGLTDGEVPLTRHAARLIMRRQLHHDWLILELRGGVTWPKRYLHEKREPSPEVGIALEMLFGNRER